MNSIIEQMLGLYEIKNKFKEINYIEAKHKNIDTI